MAQVYAAKYLAKAAMSAPRDFVRAAVAKYTPLHPTVLIFHCTFVCDARCEMCSNWKRGNRKEDMTLAQIEQAFSSPLWKDIENASHLRRRADDPQRPGRDRARDDRQVPEAAQADAQHHRPHAAPRHPDADQDRRVLRERNVIFSTRVSIDGVGEMHDEVRHVATRFDKAGKTIAAMQELQKTRTASTSASRRRSSRRTSTTPRTSWRGRKKEKLDIVFNMVRFTDAMLGNAELEKGMKPIGARRTEMRKFFLDRVRQDPLLDGQNYIYMHYADMIANGYHRTAPCPFQTQGIMLNPNGDLFFCENSDVDRQRRCTEDAEELYFRETAQKHRRDIRDEKCPTCLSPCQMNVAAIKQVVPYARFLVRASMEKRRSGAERIAAQPA